jgi:C_GCAxxG_C_C family probable redox protein
MFDMKDEAVLKAASALTGGIGGKADVCGALAGGSMMLGVTVGMGREGESIEKMVPAIMKTGEYYDWFTKEFQSSKCRDIITRFGNGTFYDFGIPEQAKAGTEAGVLEKCDNLVQNAVTKVAGIILGAQEAAGKK